MNAPLRACLAAWLLIIAACSEPSLPAPEAPAPAAAPAHPDWFHDVTAGSGLAFTYRNGQESGHLSILESLGGGVAVLDYDGDGLLDVFLPGGGYFAGPDKKQIKGHPGRLFRNLGGLKFQDVTAAAGLDRPGFYSHGAAVADFDNDGWPDLLVTGYGGLALYHNEPDGKGGRRFVEVTRKAGLADTLWSTSAAWGDLDGDGYPDLYVCHYVDWSFRNHPRCHYYDPDLPDVCPPRMFRALPHTLYRNNRDGTFTDVSKEAGLLDRRPLEHGKGLGVILVDVDGDGRPDIYVANDTTDNLLYLNRGGWRFKEVGRGAGVALDDRGMPNGSMGLAAGDYNGTGRPSLFVTNYQNDLHALYCNDGGGQFSYQTQAAGIGALDRQDVGFGTAFLDLDNHGWEDLVVGNGHVIRHPAVGGVAQKPALLRNEGAGWFRIITGEGGSYFRSKHVARGVAAVDLDNRGLADLVISHVNEPAAVLRNAAPLPAGGGHHWLGVELIGRDRRDVVGAKVVLEAGGRVQTRFAVGGGSYLTSADRRHRFGLGGATEVGRLTVVWPSGEPRTQRWKGLAVDRYWRLVQGEAAARPAGAGPKAKE